MAPRSPATCPPPSLAVAQSGRAGGDPPASPTNISARFILNATFELDEDDPERIMRHVKEIWMFKRNSQPLNTKNCGCIFKNPPGASAGRMIDQLGLKGLSVGDAQVSGRHANFFVNAGHASSKDMLALIADVRERVQKSFGVNLENEVVVWNA